MYPMKQSVYIFDVDGVLNNLQEYQPDNRIIAHMAKALDAGTFIAINTGRGYDWVRKSIVQPLRSIVQSPKAMTRLFVAVEMGGLGVEYSKNKELKTPSAFSLSPEHISAVRSVFDAHPDYAHKIYWYTKASMATIAKTYDATMNDFKPIQKELTETLQHLFAGQHVKVANSTDAIDVHAPEAGKWAGAQLIYEWLRRTTSIQHDHFVCFGDSIVDYEMARFFAEQSHDTVFVFTGPAFAQPTPHPNIKLVMASQRYNEGTYDYLRNHADTPSCN